MNKYIAISRGDSQIAREFANTAQKLDEIQVGKIFDRFYTVENARTSTGLGLSIARSLAERMNGSVTASYNDGKLLITVSFNKYFSSMYEE